MHRATTKTRSFGAGRRESQDSSPHYARSLLSVIKTGDTDVADAGVTNEGSSTQRSKWSSRKLRRSAVEHHPSQDLVEGSAHGARSDTRAWRGSAVLEKP
jgi:hypothetical protein